MTDGSDGAREAARAGCDRVDTLEAWEAPEGHPRVRGCEREIEMCGGGNPPELDQSGNCDLSFGSCVLVR